MLEYDDIDPCATKCGTFKLHKLSLLSKAQITALTLSNEGPVSKKASKLILETIKRINQITDDKHISATKRSIILAENYRMLRRFVEMYNVV